MAATVESDPVPSALQPIANVDDTGVVPPAKSGVVDAPDVATKVNQGVEEADAQLSVSDSTALSIPEVTKPSAEELVDIVSSVVFDAKKLDESTVAAESRDVDFKKAETEEVAESHSKDATVTSNVSDITTVVATNEIDDTDTRKEDAESDTKPQAVHASTAEEAPTGSLSIATEETPSAEKSTPDVEASTSTVDTLGAEPVSGSVSEDPVLSTAGEVEAPVAEQEVTQTETGELNDNDEELPDTAPAGESSPAQDTKAIPAAEEVTSGDNEDAKKEAEVEKSTEFEAIRVVEDKAPEPKVEDSVEIKAKEIEGQNAEPQQPELSIQIDEVEATPAHSASSLSVNGDSIVVEVVAPTPTLLANRELEESDSEDIPSQQESHEEAVTTSATEEELTTEGTETPRPEPEVEAAPNAVMEKVDAKDEEAVEANTEAVPPVDESSPVKEEEKVGVAAEAPTHAVAEAPAAEEPAVGPPVEISSQQEESIAEPHAELEEQPSEVSPTVAEDKSTPVEEESTIDEAPTTTIDAEATVEDTPAIVSEAEAQPPVETATTTGTIPSIPQDQLTKGTVSHVDDVAAPAPDIAVATEETPVAQGAVEPEPTPESVVEISVVEEVPKVEEEEEVTVADATEVHGEEAVDVVGPAEDVTEATKVNEEVADVVETPEALAEAVKEVPPIVKVEQPPVELVTEAQGAETQPIIAEEKVEEAPAVESAHVVEEVPLKDETVVEEPAKKEPVVVEPAAEEAVPVEVEPVLQTDATTAEAGELGSVVEDEVVDAIPVTTKPAAEPDDPQVSVAGISVEEPVAQDAPSVEHAESAVLLTTTTSAESAGEPSVQGPVVLEEPAAVSLVEDTSAPAEEIVSLKADEDAPIEAPVAVNDESVLVNENSEADTTAETIMVPEPLEKKEDITPAPVVEDIIVADLAEAPAPVDQAPEKLSLTIPEEAPAQLERPKSPWTPSFQVATIGHGVSLPADEDIPNDSLDVAEAVKGFHPEPQPIQPEIVVAENSNEAVAEEAQPSIEAVEPESATLNWTPSYSVHSQGSSSPTHAPLEPELVGRAEADDAQAVPVIQEDALMTEETVPPVTDKDDEYPQTVKTGEIEPRPAKEPVEEVQESQVWAVEAPDSELLHDEREVEVPAAAPSAAEQEVEAETQLSNQAETVAPVEELQKSLIVDTSLTPPLDQGRPDSPSWVPSYSVSQQGSPLPEQASLLAEPAEDEPAPVSFATGEPAVAEEQHLQVDVVPTVVVNGSHSEEVEEERVAEDFPSSHWTPSYSVTQQGADVLEETRIESLAPTDKSNETVSERQPRRSLSEEMEDSGAFSSTALVGAGVAGAAALAASAAFRKSTEFLEGTEESRPANGDVTLSESRREKTFPTIEIPDENKSHGALPSVDENNTLDTSVVLSPDASPISPRKRLESTTSSRLFPGGWFSNTSKIPDERTSLEVAQGVFAGMKQGVSIEETLVSPIMDPVTPVREQSSSDKRRWCVIM